MKDHTCRGSAGNPADDLTTRARAVVADGLSKGVAWALVHVANTPGVTIANDYHRQALLSARLIWSDLQYGDNPTPLGREVARLLAEGGA